MKFGVEDRDLKAVGVSVIMEEGSSNPQIAE